MPTRRAAVVAVSADWDAGGNGGAELRGVDAPLLAGIAPKEFLVEVAANNFENDVFAGFDGVTGFTYPVEEGLGTGFVEVEAVETVNGVLVDRNRKQLAVNAGEDSMLVGYPAGEAREVVDNSLGIGMEDMRTIAVDENAIGVEFVVGVAADVRAALVDDQNLLASVGEMFGDHAASEVGTKLLHCDMINESPQIIRKL